MKKWNEIFLLFAFAVIFLSSCSNAKVFNAISQNNFEQLKKEVNKNNINARNKEMSTSLIEAVKKNNYQMTEYLITNGADINKATAKKRLIFNKSNTTINIYDQTPLMFACRNGNIKTAELLLKNGANVNHLDSNGETALFYLSRNNNDLKNIAELLVKYNIDLNITSRFFGGCSALVIAEANKNEELTKYLSEISLNSKK